MCRLHNNPNWVLACSRGRYNYWRRCCFLLFATLCATQRFLRTLWGRRLSRSTIHLILLFVHRMNRSAHQADNGCEATAEPITKCKRVRNEISRCEIRPVFRNDSFHFTAFNLMVGSVVTPQPLSPKTAAVPDGLREECKSKFIATEHRHCFSETRHGGGTHRLSPQRECHAHNSGRYMR